MRVGCGCRAHSRATGAAATLRGMLPEFRDLCIICLAALADYLSGVSDA